MTNTEKVNSLLILLADNYDCRGGHASCGTCDDVWKATKAKGKSTTVTLLKKRLAQLGHDGKADCDICKKIKEIG